jgi:hypothetical protein
MSQLFYEIKAYWRTKFRIADNAALPQRDGKTIACFAVQTLVITDQRDRIMVWVIAPDDCRRYSSG